MTTTTHTSPSRDSIDRYGIKRMIEMSVFIALLGLLFFSAAGRLNWFWAWVYLCVYFAIVAANGIMLVAKNPQMINERGKSHDNTKGWDRVIILLATIAWLAMPVVAGLDLRYGWTPPLALGWNLLGVALFVAGNVVAGAAMMANTHFEMTVRIQAEREHQVVTSGPYRYVRHPGYTGVVLTMLATPLLLGTWWAFVPSAAMTLTMVVRTAMEDRTLQRELPGYADYARRTRSRLLPGVW